jgi:hypothetical protein
MVSPRRGCLGFPKGGCTRGEALIRTEDRWPAAVNIRGTGRSFKGVAAGGCTRRQRRSNRPVLGSPVCSDGGRGPVIPLSGNEDIPFGV